MGIVESFPKHPSEDYAVAVDLYGKVPGFAPGVMPASIVVTAIDIATGADSTTAVKVPSSEVVDGWLLKWRVKGGVDSKTYRYRIDITMDDDSTYVEFVDMDVTTNPELLAL